MSVHNYKRVKWNIFKCKAWFILKNAQQNLVFSFVTILPCIDFGCYVTTSCCSCHHLLPFLLNKDWTEMFSKRHLSLCYDWRSFHFFVAKLSKKDFIDFSERSEANCSVVSFTWSCGWRFELLAHSAHLMSTHWSNMSGRRHTEVSLNFPICSSHVVLPKPRICSQFYQILKTEHKNTKRKDLQHI